MDRTKNTCTGLTLLEILAVISISIAAISISSRAISPRLLQQRLLLSERDALVGHLFEARSNSMSNLNQTPYGFCIEDGKYFVVTEGNCPPTLPALKERGRIAQGITLNYVPPVGSEGIVFEQLSGQPSWSGTLTLSNQAHAVDISVSSLGVITW